MIHLGDVTKISGRTAPTVDCIIGGSPCQDLSVAGLRKGMKHSSLGDEETTRSGLFIEQIRICKEMREESERTVNDRRLVRPRYMVWENVDGCRSSNNGEDFRCVLEEVARVVEPAVTIPRPDGKQKWTESGYIVGNGYSIAWRTFDSQHWGVPQRRRRICLVADWNGWSAMDICFEHEGCSDYPNPKPPYRHFGVGCRPEVRSVGEGLSGDSQQSRAQGQEASQDASRCVVSGDCFSIQGGGATSRTANGSGFNEDRCFSLNTVDVHGVAYTMQDREGCAGGGKGALIQEDRSAALRTVNNQYLFEPVPYATHGFGEPSESDVIGTLTSEQNNHVRGDTPLVVQPYRKAGHPRNAEEPQGWDEAVVSDTLNVFDVSETRTPTVVVEGTGGIVTFGHDERGSQMSEDGITDPLTASDYKQPITVAYMTSYQDKVGALCADDYKGANKQYVEQDKNLVLPYRERDVITMDRATYNQSPNAKFAPDIRNDGVVPTIIARGPGAVSYEEVKAVDCRNATEGSIAGTLQSDADHNLNSNNVVRIRYRVRRLTPLECERLQGFPDGWTNIPDYKAGKGKLRKVSDASRYKALGNSIALPSWEFVLKRISKQYREYRPTMASLFDGIGGFPLLWQQINGDGSAVWASEIEEFPIAVTKYHFGERSNNG